MATRQTRSVNKSVGEPCKRYDRIGASRLMCEKKFISIDLTKYSLYIAITTFALAIIGLISFGVVHIGDEWWPELGFYGSVVGGFLNTILFFLKQKNK